MARFALGAGERSYVEQWPEQEWDAALRVADAFRADELAPGRYHLSPTDIIPEWLREELDGRATPALEIPAPTLCTVWLEDRDWFSLADDHPDDLDVTVSTPAGWPPIVAVQVRSAWEIVTRAGGKPFVTVDFVPWSSPEGITVAAELSAFYAVVAADDAATVDLVSETLKVRPRRRHGGGPVSDRELVEMAAVGDTEISEVVPVAWDWLYGCELASPDKGIDSEGDAR